MTDLLLAIYTRIDTPGRRKFIKYSLASVVSVLVTEIILFICYRFLKFSGGWAGFWASTLAAIPSYYLNRGWVWGKSGRSHLMKEVLPFWVMAFIGIGFSAVVSWAFESVARGHNRQPQPAGHNSRGCQRDCFRHPVDNQVHHLQQDLVRTPRRSVGARP